ncbi:hypothetical protein [Natrinema halophilum]|uniref:hypothetical protein n=1 Tax=Natrinema halophilum TaxID=1699371 RepID=UPI001F263893|nr:hypothetical protein [Natrinema halophilum]UHQ96423.1 hypothetical protein HYG82_23570 [Natrinema halophilum]
MTHSRDDLDRRVREAIRAHRDRGNCYVTVRQLSNAIEDETHQAINHAVLRIVNAGDLEPWRDVRSSSVTYRIQIGAHRCDLCGAGHDSVGATLRCCAGLFEDGPAAGMNSVRGPAPGVAAAHEERDAR